MALIETLRAWAGEFDAKPPAPSIVGLNLRISGNIESDGDLQLDGIVDGDVKSQLLAVGETAVINGSIVGDVIRISGTVNGEITGRVVELTQTAKITGDINHERLMIEAGAYVQGLCRHVELPQVAEVPAVAGPAKPNLVVEDAAGTGDGRKPDVAPKKVAFISNFV